MARKLILSFVVLLLSLFAVEVYFRNQPLLRVQGVRKLDNHTLRIFKGVPIWETKDTARTGVYNRDCLETAVGGPDVYLLGDSIFYGVRLPPEKTLGPLLQDRLSNELDRSACVVNLAEPGFGFLNEKTVLEEAMAEHKPKVVLLQIWFNSPNRFVVVGEDAYNFGTLVTDSLGVPNLGLPSGLNQRLFQRSATWRNISTGFVPTQDGRRVKADKKWTTFTETELEPFRQWLSDQGIQLMIAYATSLKTPFSEGRQAEDNIYGVPRRWATENGLIQVSFAEVFGKETPEDVGIDACCHLSEYGTQLVADALVPGLVQLLEAEAQ